MKNINKILLLCCTFASGVYIDCSQTNANEIYSVGIDSNKVTVIFTQASNESYSLTNLINCKNLIIVNPTKICMFDNVNLGTMANIFDINAAYPVTVKLDSALIVNDGNAEEDTKADLLQNAAESLFNAAMCFEDNEEEIKKIHLLEQASACFIKQANILEQFIIKNPYKENTYSFAELSLNNAAMCLKSAKDASQDPDNKKDLFNQVSACYIKRAGIFNRMNELEQNLMSKFKLLNKIWV